MAGKEHDGPFRAGGMVAEIAQRPTHRALIEVVKLHHLVEAEAAQGGGHLARVVLRIVERPDVCVVGIADHERDAFRRFRSGRPREHLDAGAGDLLALPVRRIRRRQLDDLLKIGDRLRSVAQPNVDESAVVVGPHIVRLETDRFVIVGNRAIEIFFAAPRVAAIIVDRCIFWIEPRGLVQIRDRRVKVLLFVVVPATVIVGEVVLRLETDRFVQIRKREIVLADFHVGPAAVAVDGCRRDFAVVAGGEDARACHDPGDRLRPLAVLHVVGDGRNVRPQHREQRNGTKGSDTHEFAPTISARNYQIFAGAGRIRKIGLIVMAGLVPAIHA